MNPMSTMLVTGVAGYIGSAIAWDLIKAGHDIIGIDDLSTGYERFIPTKAQFILGSILDKKLMLEVGGRVDGVVHAAGIKYANQSSLDPSTFYEINATGSLNAAMAARNSKRKMIVFSSSCAVYGNANGGPVVESSSKNPITPYGRSKLMAEEIFSDFADAYGLNYVALRFFNVIGASESGSYDMSTFNLFPNLCRAIQQSTVFEIFGTNLPTSDGSCIRDYVDVNDISRAHTTVIEKLLHNTMLNKEYNLGLGKGISNLQIVREFETQISRKIQIVDKGSRKGDPIEVFANPALANEDLNWIPSVDLATSVKSQHKLFTQSLV